MKVLVVGAGPIGCYTARLLQKYDRRIEVVVIEEHAEIGKPIHCAGLVSSGVLRQVKIPVGKDMVLQRIDGAEFFFNGDSFTVRRKGIAQVIDRAAFDRALGEGLRVDFNTRFVGIEQENGGYIVETDKREYYADIVVGADGANSNVRRMGGFQEKIEYLRGVQFRIRMQTPQPQLVGVYIKNPFFAWVIPESDSVSRVGIISHNPYHDLLDFLKSHALEGDVLEKFAGVVPLGSCQTQKGTVVLVGDAACQVKPLTHGGIYYGMRCAEILADCIARRRLPDYEKRWRWRFAREIQMGLSIRGIYETLSAENIETLFAFLKKNRRLIEKFGDFEKHSRIIGAILKSQALRGLFGRALSSIIKDVSI